MPKRASPFIARLAAAALLLVFMANYPAQAEHSLEELKASYVKNCRMEQAWATMLSDQIKKTALTRSVAKANGCFGPTKRKICNSILTKLGHHEETFVRRRIVYLYFRKKCNQARAAYQQALGEAVLTKWLKGPPEKSFEAATKETLKSLRKKAAKKKKTTKKKTVRKQPKPKHSTEASTAVGIAIIGIIGGYVGSKAARKKSRRAPSGGGGRSGGHHHAGSGYN